MAKTVNVVLVNTCLQISYCKLYSQWELDDHVSISTVNSTMYLEFSLSVSVACILILLVIKKDYCLPNRDRSIWDSYPNCLLMCSEFLLMCSEFC